MEYALIHFSGEKEILLEELLLSLARHESSSPASGYSFSVEGYLKETLSYFELQGQELDTPGAFPIFRVYSEVREEPEKALVAGDSLRNWGDHILRNQPLRGLISYIYISSSFPPDVDWGLIGIATPGWVLLFDEDSEYVNRAAISDDVKVIYCPSDENFLDRFSPDVETLPSLEMTLKMILENVPPRSEKEDTSSYGQDL
ncbi:MAG TPA: hypothetical protein PLV56_00150 [Synergistales bacterium]|nr:hypothetical protein [Synergistales bacterium]